MLYSFLFCFQLSTRGSVIQKGFLTNTLGMLFLLTAFDNQEGVLAYSKILSYLNNLRSRLLVAEFGEVVPSECQLQE